MGCYELCESKLRLGGGAIMGRSGSWAFVEHNSSFGEDKDFSGSTQMVYFL